MGAGSDYRNTYQAWMLRYTFRKHLKCQLPVVVFLNICEQCWSRWIFAVTLPIWRWNICESGRPRSEGNSDCTRSYPFMYLRVPSWWNGGKTSFLPTYFTGEKTATKFRWLIESLQLTIFSRISTFDRSWSHWPRELLINHSLYWGKNKQTVYFRK